MESRAIVDVLVHLLTRLDAYGTVEIGFDESERWPDGAFDCLSGLGLLTQAGNATRITCTECEEMCLIEPSMRRKRDGSLVYYYLDCPRGNSLLTYEPRQLERWHLDPGAVARWVAEELALKGTVVQRGKRLWHLGRQRHGTADVECYLGWGWHSEEKRQEAVELLGERAVLLAAGEKPSGSSATREYVQVIPIRELLTVKAGALRLDDRLFKATLGRPTRKKSIEPLDLPAGTSWSRVVMRVIDEAHVEIQAGTRKWKLGFSRMGMGDARDERGHSRPTLVWETLLVFAQVGGALSKDSEITMEGLPRLEERIKAPVSIESTPRSGGRRVGERALEDELTEQDHMSIRRAASVINRKDVVRLRDKLLELFDPGESPISDYRSGKGWVTAFRISDQRQRPA